MKSKGVTIVKIQESAENYMETILILSRGDKPVRAVDIANELEYTKPSISVALKNLRLGGYIETDPDGFIVLTDKGLKIAESMYERHILISDWLIFLGVDKQTAVNDACKMEHVLSQQSFLAIKQHVENWYGKKQV